MITLEVEDTYMRSLIDATMKLQEEKKSLIALLPDEFKDNFGKEAYISGGSIYSLYNNRDVKDYDFFLRSSELAESLTEYFIDVAGYKGSKVSGGIYKDLPLVVTENAISIGKYQIITQWIGNPKEVVEQFDFKHLMFYIENDKIETFSDHKYLKTLELFYNKKRARDIVGTVMRVNKFVSRGMFIRQGEMSKILLKLHEVGFSDKELTFLKDKSNDDHFSS